MRSTRHFQTRQSHRGLRRCVLEFILDYGVEIAAAGARFRTVHERSLPAHVDRRLREQARDWVVVVGEDGVLLTCYRRADAYIYVRRKDKLDRAAKVYRSSLHVAA